MIMTEVSWVRVDDASLILMTMYKTHKDTDAHTNTHDHLGCGTALWLSREKIENDVSQKV